VALPQPLWAHTKYYQPSKVPRFAFEAEGLQSHCWGGALGVPRNCAYVFSFAPIHITLSIKCPSGAATSYNSLLFGRVLPPAFAAPFPSALIRSRPPTRQVPPGTSMDAVPSPAQPSPAHSCRRLQFSIHETRPRQPWTRQTDGKESQNYGDGGGSAVGHGASVPGTASSSTGAAAPTPPGPAKSRRPQATASVSGYSYRYRWPVEWRRTAAVAVAASGSKPRSAVRHTPFRIPADDTVRSVSAPATAASASGAYRRRQSPGGCQCCCQCRCTTPSCCHTRKGTGAGPPPMARPHHGPV
jgi:hypothetical protein